MKVPTEERKSRSKYIDDHHKVLSEVVIAFVDIGFGISSTALSLSAANDNNPIKGLALQHMEKDE